MIIFFNKKTKEIIGTIHGRVHNETQLKMTIRSESLSKDEVGRYVVPFKTKFRIVEQPITELRMVDEKTKRVEEVVIGKKKVKQGAGMIPDVPFDTLIYDFESGKKRIYDYVIKLENRKVVGFKKK